MTPASRRRLELLQEALASAAAASELCPASLSCARRRPARAGCLRDARAAAGPRGGPWRRAAGRDPAWALQAAAGCLQAAASAAGCVYRSAPQRAGRGRLRVGRDGGCDAGRAPAGAALRATMVVNVLVEASTLGGHGAARPALPTGAQCEEMRAQFKDASDACSAALAAPQPLLREPLICIATGSQKTCDPCCLVRTPRRPLRPPLQPRGGGLCYAAASRGRPTSRRCPRTRQLRGRRARAQRRARLALCCSALPRHSRGA